MSLVNEGITVTKTDSTKAAYLDRAQSLIKRFKKISKGSAISHADLVDWLISLKPEISRATWRQYKASIVWYLEHRKDSEQSERLIAIGNDGCRDVKKVPVEKRNTSSRKKKSVTEREEELIVEYLTETSKDSFWSRPTLAFFKAIMATGLRPEEWQQSTLLTEPNNQFTFEAYPVLRVRNAKQTNGRAHGEYRHLVLDDIDAQDLLYIRIALQYAHPKSPQGWLTQEGKAASWHDYYDFLRAHLYRVTCKLFPTCGRRVTIYSCRHQFIANLKKAKFSKEEIAAIVGHSTDETATVHYGRAKYGRSKKGLPKPNPEEVKLIRNVYQPRPTPGQFTGPTMEPR